MKRYYKKNDHLVTKIVLGAFGVLAGLAFFRAIPDLVRYVKMERM
jgi:hypothetical protein